MGAATDQRNAVRATAAPLIGVGVTAPEYGKCCIGSTGEPGPYFVLGPGVALIHARVEGTCLRPRSSLLRLDEPVGFGHEVSDLVDLVFCLASPDNETHIAGLRAFALAMSDDLAKRLCGVAPGELAGPLAGASAVRVCWETGLTR